MFQSLSDKLQATLGDLRSRGALSADDIDRAMREIRLALLEADVNFRVVKTFVAAVRERSVGQEVLSSLTPGQQVVKIVDEELTELLGAAGTKLDVRVQAADRDPALRPAGLGQDDRRRQAREPARSSRATSRRSSPATSSARPPSSS